MSMNQFTPDTASALLQSSQNSSAQAAEKLKNSARSRQMEQMTEAAKDFEAVFLTEMMRPMFETVETNSMFGGGKGEKAFKSMLVDEYGKMLASSGAVGIADEIRAEMIRMQEAADSGNPYNIKQGNIENGTQVAMTTQENNTTKNQ